MLIQQGYSKVLVLIRFKKGTRHWKILGRRAVAGRLVKESYGSAKQQHTFIVVEVLWSKGVKKLPPLPPLPVKGRNLSKGELSDNVGMVSQKDIKCLLKSTNEVQQQDVREQRRNLR